MKKRCLLIPLSLLAVPVFAFQAGMFPVLGSRPTVEERERYAALEAYNPEAGVFQNRRLELFAQTRENTEFLPMVHKWFSERADGRPTSRLPEQQPDLQAFLAPGSDTRVIWFGHSTFLLNVAGTIVLVDPVFSETAAPAQHFSGRDGVNNNISLNTSRWWKRVDHADS